MKTSQNGINLIKKYEGCRLEAYKCPAGVWTIGYGHTGADVRQGLKINQTQADEYLKKDLEKFERTVNSIVKIPLNQNQFDALVSFTYNCGSGNLRTLVNGRGADVIAQKIVLYNKSNGKVLEGLQKRRNDEKALFVKK